MTAREADSIVVEALDYLGSGRAADILAYAKLGGRWTESEAYRPIDRALQRLRKQGRIALTGRRWQLTGGKEP